MRALILAGVEQLEVRHDLAEPTVQAPTDAVIRVEAAGLCGSDLHPYLGREPIRWGTVPGHEAVGVITSIGQDVRRFALGDRVLVPFTTSCGVCEPCQSQLSSRCTTSQLFGWAPPSSGDGPGLPGGQAESLRVPQADGTLVLAPTGTSDEDAVLLCDNAPTGWYAATRAEVRPGSRVAVVGLGAVGLCTVWASLAQGASEVIAVDPVASRRARAASLGATVFAPDQVPAELRVPCVIEAAGPASAQSLAASLAAPGATISIIAVQTDASFAVSAIDAYDRNLTVRFGRAPVRSILDELLPRLATGDLVLPTDAVVTQTGLSLDEGPAAYRRFAARDGDLVKLVFSPRGDRAA